MIEHITSEKGGGFYYQPESTRLAAMTYVNADNKIIIDHTEVAPSLQGKSIGKQLLETLVEFARASKLKVIPLCPYAKSLFKRNKDWQDVLA
ncbi:MAG: N-acetyltransferase [Cyclobacteriaceae bacterium]|nr:N-acetyltransferase [Cyclobacteriaceae bacterium]